MLYREIADTICWDLTARRGPLPEYVSSIYAIKHPMLTTRKIHALELTTIAFYAVLLAIISYFHEPWFDEAQAWLIARDSSLFDMIWHVLRYEGHTPLWYLFLYIPAHLHLPYELSLKAINIVFATLAAGVLIKYSPFPLPVRLLTPFTYYLFYQYGAINRSYSLLMLLLWIIAAAFPKRNKKPFLFSFLLACLGGVTVHGMLIAFGIAIAWLIEILMDHSQKTAPFSHTLRQTATDRRFSSLVFLGLINISYVAILWPMPDLHTPQYFIPFSVGKFVYRLLIAPVGAFFYGEEFGASSYQHNTAFSFYLIVVGLLIVAVFLIWAFNSGKSWYLLLPYLFFTLFVSFVYFSSHHTGLYALLAIFSLWISLNGNQIFKKPVWAQRILKLLYGTGKRLEAFKSASVVLLIILFAIQIYWTISSSTNEIKYSYAPAKDIARFIKDNGMEGKQIFDFYYVENRINSYLTENIAVLPYFSENIFYNQNPQNPTISYAAHRKLDDAYLLKILKRHGAPEFILLSDKPLPLYDGLFKLTDYRPLRSFMGQYIHKDLKNPSIVVLYIRKDMSGDFPSFEYK